MSGYINFNATPATSETLPQLLDAVESFARKKGFPAANAWLKKLNPWVQGHTEAEMDFTGGGYTRRTARALVSGEYDDQRLPTACPDGCGGVAWYKATVGVNICSCGALDLDGPNDYLSFVLEDSK